MIERKTSALRWAAVVVLLVSPVVSEVGFEDGKNFFFFPSPPHAGAPPTVTYSPPGPAHSSGGGHANPTPSHSGGTPPANCPSGGQHHPTPSSPSGHHSPPTTPTSPPTTPIVIPGTPTPPSSPPPFTLDPNTTPPFTCTFWRNHPTLIWGLAGWWGTVASALGTPNLPGAHMNLLQALSNARPDSIGDLYREGTAALLNSMVQAKFPYTTTHIRDSFTAALSSKKAAAAQAQLFRLANEGRIKIRV